MPTTYLRFVYSTPESPAFRYDFDKPEEQSILLFDPVAEATKSDLGSLFGQVYPHFKTSDLIIIRGAGPEFIDLMKDRSLQEQVTGKRVVALVGALSAGSPGPQWHRVDDAPMPDGLPPIADACQTEVEAVLRRTKAIFDEKHYHYALPSKRHADKFVRLGDALHSVFDSHRIAEWLLPHLSRHTVVIGDTGSMLPLLCSLKEQAQRLSLNVEIGNFDRYPLSKGEVKDAIEAIKDRRVVADWALAGIPYTCLFVISVNSTGQVLKWIILHAAKIDTFSNV